MEKLYHRYKCISRTTKAIIGLVLLIVFIVILSSVFTSQISIFVEEPLVPGSQPTSVSSLATVAQTELMQGWKVYRSEQLGFSIQYPENWHEVDPSHFPYLRRQCFSPIPDDLLAKPQFCVEISPFVIFPGLGGLASDTSTTQQEFFQALASRHIGRTVTEGGISSTVVRNYQLVASPAVEVIEMNSPNVEVTEPFYIVAIYVNHSQLGLIRLWLSAGSREQFEEHNSFFRQMSASFSPVK
jgi:hypothetical protein